MSRSWPKYGDNPDKYREVRYKERTAELAEPALHINHQAKECHCQFDTKEGCSALACYDSSTKCGCRDANGNPQYI